MSSHRHSASAGAVILSGDMETEDSASNAASDLDDYWAEADDAIFDASSPTSRKFRATLQYYRGEKKKFANLTKLQPGRARQKS